MTLSAASWEIGPSEEEDEPWELHMALRTVADRWLTLIAVGCDRSISRERHCDRRTSGFTQLDSIARLKPVPLSARLDGSSHSRSKRHDDPANIATQTHISTP